jgi:hypothetical protein
VCWQKSKKIPNWLFKKFWVKLNLLKPKRTENDSDDFRLFLCVFVRAWLFRRLLKTAPSVIVDYLYVCCFWAFLRLSVHFIKLKAHVSVFFLFALPSKKAAMSTYE